jgi:galactose mutarotase-like enzyme
MEVKILTYGGILQSIRVPDRHGRLANVTLGFDNLADYVAKSPYFGCITGRYANRIAKGQFQLNGTTYQLPINNPPNSLHGGDVGFDKHVWAATPVQDRHSVGLELRFTSPNGDQGYPGTLANKVTYTLTNRNEIRMDYRARLVGNSNLKTVINLTNHAYWNLAGEGSSDIYGHKLTLKASHYTPGRPDPDPHRGHRPGGRHPDGLHRSTAIGAASATGSSSSSSAAATTTTGCSTGTAAASSWPPGSSSPGAAGSWRSSPTSRASSSTPATSWTGRWSAPAAGCTAGRRVRAGDPALPGLAQPPQLPVDRAGPGQRYATTTIYKFSTD